MQGKLEDYIIQNSHVIAVVGLSPNPDRPSNEVGRHMQENGFRVIPVNPTAKEILGEVCYPDLTAIPEKVDVVDIFRRSEDVPPIVEQAIKIGAKSVWMQEGVINEDAALRARQAGLNVVMDSCIWKEYRRLRGI